MSVLNKLPPFANVVAGSTAIIPRVPMGLQTIRGILLESNTALTIAEMTRIKIRVGSKTIFDMTGTELDTINKYRNFTADSNYLYIPFSDLNARTITGEEVGGLDTSLFNQQVSMQVEVDISSTAGTGLSLDAYYDFDPPKAPASANKAITTVYLKTQQSIAGSGKYPIELPIGSSSGAQIKRIYTIGTNITQVEFKRDGILLLEEGTTAVLKYIQELAKRRDSQTNLHVVDFTLSNNQSLVVPTLRADGNLSTLDFRITTSAASSPVIIVELYAQVAQV